MRHFAVLAALVAACGGEALPRVCESGRTQACACVGGGQGAQVCALSGLSWGACVCGDGGAADAVQTPVDAPTAPVDATDATSVAPDASDASTSPPDVAVEASVCPSGWGECSPGVCANLATTAANCGACGATCPTHARCDRGSCVSPSGLTCPPTMADCDNNPMTGCEAQLWADHTNCGTCGNNCRSRGLYCRGSTCAP